MKLLIQKQQDFRQMPTIKSNLSRKRNSESQSTIDLTKERKHITLPSLNQPQKSHIQMIELNLNREIREIS